MVLVCMLALRTQNLEKKLQEIELRLVPTVEMWARLGANLRPCLELVCTLWLRYLLRFLRRSRKTCHDCLWMPRSVKASVLPCLYSEPKERLDDFWKSSGIQAVMNRKTYFLNARKYQTAPTTQLRSVTFWHLEALIARQDHSYLHFRWVSASDLRVMWFNGCLQ